jgi:hypothetical protein
VSWTQMMGINRTTGRVYTRAEIRELEKAAHEAGLEVGRQALRAYKEQESQPDLEGLRKQARAEGYAAGLSHAWRIVDALDGRPGKNQIRDLLEAELHKVKGGN